jgi:hypothetical protein
MLPTTAIVQSKKSKTHLLNHKMPATVSAKGSSKATAEVNVAESPFDDPNADLVLRSSDNVEFRVHQFLLSLLSPVFRDMLTLPQGPEAHSEGRVGEDRPVVPLSEDGRSLRLLLIWCDPRCSSICHTLEDFQLVLEVAEKYDMESVTKRVMTIFRLKMVLYVVHEPVRIFALSMRYRLEELARLAAKCTLLLTLEERTHIPELKYISGSTLHHLQEYYFACGRAASKVATDFGWIKNAFIWNVDHRQYDSLSWVTQEKWEETMMEGGKTRHKEQWWLEYMELAAEALTKRPRGKTVTEPDFAAAPLNKAHECKRCGPRSYLQLKQFNKLFAEEVERVVAQVKPECCQCLIARLIEKNVQVSLVVEF